MDRKKTDITLKELDIALDNRVFEIQSFWQRSNYFLVLLTALGAATFAIEDIVIQFILSVLSAFCAWFWYRTNLGSKFWQESWEVEVNLLSEELEIESFRRSMEDVKKQVADSLGVEEVGKGLLRRFVDKQIVAKPSVTHNMILLSMLVFTAWIVVSTIFAVRLFNLHCEWHRLYVIC